MGFEILQKKLAVSYCRGERKFFSKTTPWGLQKILLEKTSPLTGINIIGFFWQTNLSKGMQKRRFVPNLRKVGQILQFVEHKHIILGLYKKLPFYGTLTAF